MSFDARNALMLAKKIVDSAAEYKKVAQKADGGAAKAKVIPHGDKKRESNLSAFLKGNHPEVPSVAYHGTTGDFYEFLNRMSGSSTGSESAKLGHWFTDNPRVAKSYADYSATYAPVQKLLNIAERYGKKGDWEAHDHFINEAEKLEKSFAEPEGEKQGQNIVPVHLSMKKPYIIDAKGENYSSIEDGFTKQLQHAKRKGHDGVIVKNLDDAAGLYNVPANHYLVFNPTQIKSSTGNQGTFDPTNPDITKSEGGEVARKTNKIGLFSKAAEQARQLPSGAVPAAQLISTLRNKGGIKAEELTNAGITDQAGNLSPEWQSKGKIAPEDLAAHFDEHLPEIEETVLGKTIKGTPYPEEYKKIEQTILAKYKPDLERLHQINIDPSHDRETRNKALNEKEALQEKIWSEIDAAIPDRDQHVEASRDKTTPTKYHEWALPGGENYREVLLKLPKQEHPLNVAEIKIDEINKKLNEMERAGVPEDSPEWKLANSELMKADINAQNIRNKMQSGEIPYQLTPFQSSHWDEPNVLAHIRMSDRYGPNGEKILHVEEVQSDWGQKGKKEGFKDIAEKQYEEARKAESFATQKIRDLYKQLLPTNLTESEIFEHPEFAKALEEEAAAQNLRHSLEEKIHSGVTSAPYVTSTQGWTDLALKRILKEAAEGGYDKVIWTPGSEQAGRYDLSKHIDSVKYLPAYFNPITGNSFSGKLVAYKKGSAVINRDVMQPDDVSDIIGKDLANKLLQTEQKKGPQDFRPYHYLEGEDLSVGGEGMKEYYDNILPKRFNAVAQKHDKTAKVKYTDVMLPPSGKRGSNNPPMQAPGLDITPQMRDSILSGQEAYARGGDVMHTRKVPKPHTPVVGERQHKPSHPAMMIPGVHIIERIHGVPFFMGKK